MCFLSAFETETKHTKRPLARSGILYVPCIMALQTNERNMRKLCSRIRLPRRCVRRCTRATETKYNLTCKDAVTSNTRYVKLAKHDDSGRTLSKQTNCSTILVRSSQLYKATAKSKPCIMHSGNNAASSASQVGTKPYNNSLPSFCDFPFLSTAPLNRLVLQNKLSPPKALWMAATKS